MGYSAVSNMILRTYAKSKMLPNSSLLLFAALFDLHLYLIIKVLDSTGPHERLLKNRENHV